MCSVCVCVCVCVCVRVLYFELCENVMKKNGRSRRKALKKGVVFLLHVSKLCCTRKEVIRNARDYEGATVLLFLFAIDSVEERSEEYRSSSTFQRFQFFF